MQKKCLFLILLGISELLFGQHFIEKSIDVNSQNIEIICRSIDNLKLISTFDKKVKIYLADAPYRLTNIDVYTEKDKLIIKQLESQPQESINKFCVEQPVFASYIISVPYDSHVFINIISGNLTIVNFKGTVSAQIETGAVILDDNKGEIDLKLVDGSVIGILKNSQLDLVTNLGEIESNLPQLLVSSNKKSLKGIYHNDQNKLTIKAIKANIKIEASKN